MTKLRSCNIISKILDFHDMKRGESYQTSEMHLSPLYIHSTPSKLYYIAIEFLFSTHVGFQIIKYKIISEFN
jgi:hypothetical protein